MIPIGAAAILIVLTGIAVALYGSPAAALAQLRGEMLTLSSDYIDFGRGSAGQVMDASVSIYNWTAQPVRLVGGTSDCSCVTTADLPLTIPAGQARVVTIRMKIPATKAGAVTRMAELWTDYPELRIVGLQIGCRVLK